MTPETTTQWTLEPCLCGNTSCMTQRLTNGKHHIGTIDDPDDALIARAAPELLAALEDARAALHFHYVEWDGEPEDAVPLQLARAKCAAAIAKAKGGAA